MLYSAILTETVVHLDNGTTVRNSKYIIKGRNALMLNSDFTKAIFSLYKNFFPFAKKT